MQTTLSGPAKRFCKYALLGPLIGLALIDAGLIIYFIVNLLVKLVSGGITVDFILNQIGGFFVVNIYGFFLAYVIGIVPAVMAGAAAIICHNKPQECVMAAFFGALPFLVILVAQIHQGNVLIWLLLAAIAAASALICALKNEKVRAQ